MYSKIISTVCLIMGTLTPCVHEEARASSFDGEDSFLTQAPYRYDSFEDLQEKALEVNIEFIHGLSRFTVGKMSESTQTFFAAHGALTHNDHSPENVQIIDGFALDLKSNLAVGPTVYIGQNIDTGDFLAFKLYSDDSALSAYEIQTLESANVYHELVTFYTSDSSEPSHCIGLQLIDGFLFEDIWKLSSLINNHTRYLMAYNLIKEIERFSSLELFQVDQHGRNFMVDLSDFSVKSIDFDRVINTPDAMDRKYSLLLLCQYIFKHDRYSSMAESFTDAIKGSFQDLFKTIKKEGLMSARESLEYLPFRT